MTSTPPLATLTAPLSVRPLTMRSTELPSVARSRVPLSVTPLRKLLPLAVPSSAPVPVVAMVPPEIVVPFWTSELPAPTLITPPALLMLLLSLRMPAAAPPTLMTPVLIVEPPPPSVKVAPVMPMVPALLRV